MCTSKQEDLIYKPPFQRQIIYILQQHTTECAQSILPLLLHIAVRVVFRTNSCSSSLLP